ncbi:MAG: discoidin domain-containing protein [Eubacterium sp.]|nr:discoidin domain-containing protein [Eubacterium sp.]
MRRSVGRIISVFLVLCLTFSIAPIGQFFNIETIKADTVVYNLSQDRPVFVSSGNNEDYAVDGNTSTRWQANQGDTNEWLYVDLGKVATIDYLYLHWEAAYAKYYNIQVSDDEMNWTTVYEKKKEEASDVEMAVSYRYTGTRTDGDYRFSVNWTSVEDAHYKVYLDGEDDAHIAYAGGDNYRFTNHGGTSGDVRMSQGEHTLTVVAFDPSTNREMGRGVLELDAQEDASGNNGVEVDPTANLKQTISADDWSIKEARYVKIVTTQRATAYGSSLYEFQVWGTGGKNKPPENYGTNLALNKDVTCSGTRDEWWMKDGDGNIKPEEYDKVKPENAVDGNTSTSFTSHQGEEDQWLVVDLGQAYDIGRVVTRFNEDGSKIYDIQVSADKQEWTTIHRNLRGYMNMIDMFRCYRTNVRYIRFLGYSKVESGSGHSIRELEVYEYVEGDSKENEVVPDLPTRQIINNPNGKGSYVTGEIKKELNKLPTFVNEENVNAPIDSNSWWSSFMIKTYGNMAVIHPLKAQFSNKGLGMLLASQGYTDERKPQDLGVGYYTEKLMDFYLKPESFEGSSGYDRVEGYGDFHVDVGLCDDEGLKMKSTMVKGSPYIFSEFYEDTVMLSSSSIFHINTKDSNSILENPGDTYTGDNIVIHTSDSENDRSGSSESDFLICVPENTTFTAKNVGNKTLIKIQFESTDNAYISACGMHEVANIDSYYQHAYNRVTGTKVSYKFNKDNNKITTTYHADVNALREELSLETVLGFYPHQWKHRTEGSAGEFDTYKSIRGDIKMYGNNDISTTQQFAGILPTFAKPNSSKLEKNKIKSYINTVVNEIGTGPNADAYWQGKAVHPLAITALMADQIGETDKRDQLLKDLKKIMTDWFTYSGGDDRCYLIYNKDWGTLYYPESAYGANAAICDHHFTYGYFLFGAAVLSCYDRDFYNKYKDMVELMLRDYADPEEPRHDDYMFCKFRSFDQYSGHSWAGGYADNDDGNNQESASESLFSWVGMYLWGEASKQDKYIDAGAYGFTTEMEAVKQYWFDYDGDNWLESYPFQGTGQVYGASYSYGTFFGGQPLYIYGIQWLPISEYLTNYGMEQEKCARTYQGLLDETEDAKEKVMINANIVADKMREQGKTQDEIDEYLAKEQNTADTYPTADTGWQHITWPYLSQTDPELAYQKFTAGVDGVQKEDRANTYWFISAMDSLGYKTTDYIITGATISGSVYKKTTGQTTKYTGEVWNPTAGVKTVYVVDNKTGEKIGKAKVGSKGLVQFEIDPEGGFIYTQNPTPKINARGLKSGEVKKNVTGTVRFDDTQMVELTCDDEDAEIYYTTNGDAPTTDSKKYEEEFMVSSDCTVKAVAVKERSIDSAYAACNFKIEGDTIQSNDNLAFGKTVKASSKQDSAPNIVDGTSNTHWQAEANDNEWIYVDLGSVQTINTVKINWEAAFPSEYEIQVSTDVEDWTTVSEENGKAGYVTSIFDAVSARYVKMKGIKRATVYGYNIFEMEVYGANKAKAPTISPTSGTYNEPQTVTLDTPVAGAEVKYTTDGSTPTEDSKTYVEPFELNKSAIVKAITYRKGMVLSDVVESCILIRGTIGLNKTKANIAVGSKLQLSSLSADTVTWDSNDDAVAMVDANGLVTAKDVGSATITATANSGATATCEITVTEAKHVTKVDIKPAVLAMKAKSSDTVKGVVTPADATDDLTAVWESDNETIATVNDNGTITAYKEGTVNITCTIAGETGTCAVTVGPKATVKEMVSDIKYNLAIGKNVKVSSIYSGEGSQTTNVLTDGNLNSQFVVTDWDNTHTSEYVIIDLGENYDTKSIDALAIQFVNANTFATDYSIEMSENDITYKNVGNTFASYGSSDNGLAVLSLADYSSKLSSVRYVKIKMNGHLNWGFQMREVAVLSTQANAKTVEVEHCEDPAEFTATSNEPFKITCNIVAGSGQNSYEYLVFLDGFYVGEIIGGGILTVATAGKHTVKAVSYYNGKLSEGITRIVEVSDGSLRDYVDTAMNLAKGAEVTVEDIYPDEGSQDPQKLTDGDINGQQVETMWGEDDATITLHLTKPVNASDINEVLLKFVNNITYAKAFNIQFSSDGADYETVANVTDGKYADPVEVKVDTGEYSQGTVEYVKINFTQKSSGYGYQLREIAVMGNPDNFLPTEAEGLALSSNADGEIDVSFSSSATNGQTYKIYIDDELVGINLVSAGTYKFTSLEGGPHTVRVTSVLNGIESNGVSAKISVQESTETVTIEEDGDDDPDIPISTKDPSQTTKKETTTIPGESTEPASQADTTADITTAADTTAAGGVTTTVSTKKNIAPAKPAKVKIKKAIKKKSAKKLRIVIKKVKAKGYQVAVYKTKKNAKKNKKALFKKYINKNVAKFTIKHKKLKKKKRLFVRVRAYNIDSKKAKIFGAWSAIKKVKGK